MEILRDYQTRKQLGLVDEKGSLLAFDPANLRNRILVAYNRAFAKVDNSLGMQADSNVRSPSTRKSRGSPSIDESSNVKGLIRKVSDLEARVRELEEEKGMLSVRYEEGEMDHDQVRKQLAEARAENSKLKDQVRSLQSVISSENRAEKVLERANHAESSNLEFKIEIYRQQILMLNRELDELRSTINSVEDKMSDAAEEYLKKAVPELDQEMLAYARSLAEDESLEHTERLELLSEFLGSVNEIRDVQNISDNFTTLLRERIKGESSQGDVAQVISACLDVIRAPSVSIEASIESIDPNHKRDLLRRYDGDDVVLSTSKAKGDGDSDDGEIMGLGRNENKLRVSREREELRAKAKQVQEEAIALKVAQKLKSQGDTIKHRTLGRKGK